MNIDITFMNLLTSFVYELFINACLSEKHTHINVYLVCVMAQNVCSFKLFSNILILELGNLHKHKHTIRCKF